MFKHYFPYLSLSLGLLFSQPTFSQNLNQPIPFLEDTKASIQIDDFIEQGKNKNLPVDKNLQSQYVKGCNISLDNTLISIKSIDHVVVSKNKLGFELFNNKSLAFNVLSEHIPSIIHYISQNRYNCSRPLRHRTNLYPSKIH